MANRLQLTLSILKPDIALNEKAVLVCNIIVKSCKRKVFQKITA